MQSQINKLIKALLGACALVSLITTILVVLLLLLESFQFFKKVSLTEFLFGTHWAPLLEPKSFGVLPLVSGTLMIVVGAMLLALPIGLFIAIFLSEYATETQRKIIKPILEVLAGIPTVVYGFFALTFISPLLKTIFEDIEVFNALSGAIVVGIMIVPMISSVCDDALQSLPMSLREAAYSLGARPSELILKVLIPAASVQIWAAVVLAVSRAIGETMAVTLASGATPKLLASPLESIQTMTAYIVQVSMGDTPHGGIEYLTCFAVAALLFVITLIMNFFGHKMLSRFQRMHG